jgi:predicted Ser/Thr protein kinase
MQRYSVLMHRYRILEKIGEGGFGLVYKASDKKNGRIVAIKQINIAALSMQEIIDATDSYNREITLLPRLMHKSLPQLYEYFTDEDHWYIVMEYINGETLEEVLTKLPDGRLPLKQVLEIGMELCDVLMYLHGQQPSIIYRDVKPANIMLTTKGDIYLIDFGIARRYRAGQLRDTGRLGSPGYAAPEQYGKAQTTPQTDVYGLGATLQTLLTGKEPLEIATGGVPPDCAMPTELQRFITYMMNSDASRRPSDMRIVGRFLQSTKKRLTGSQNWFVSPFTWLATLWFLCMFMIGSIFFSTLGAQMWMPYFCLASGATIIVSGRYFYKVRRTIVGKLTIKEKCTIINEALFRLLPVMSTWFMVACFFSLIPLFFHPQLARIGAIIGLFVVTIGVMFLILKGLPWLLKWLMRAKTAQKSQKPDLTPPLQQKMP